eukprot:3246987-Pleurochrysis_carterae.AAC.1
MSVRKPVSVMNCNTKYPLVIRPGSSRCIGDPRGDNDICTRKVWIEITRPSVAVHDTFLIKYSENVSPCWMNDLVASPRKRSLSVG